jgi:hypothetical protein
LALTDAKMQRESRAVVTNAVVTNAVVIMAARMIAAPLGHEPVTRQIDFGNRSFVRVAPDDITLVIGAAIAPSQSHRMHDRLLE